jgi:hypothetical protein
MAIAKLQSFNGLRPKDSARVLPDDAAQTANNLLATTTEFRPLAADTTIVAASGVTNPTTIYRMQRLSGGALNLDFASAANWKITALEKSYVKGPLNDNATERTYVTTNDGSVPPHVIDNTGQDRQLGVPAPTTAPGITVNVVADFTPSDRSAGLAAALQAAITAVQTNVTAVFRGAAHPGTSQPGYIDRNATFIDGTVNDAQQLRCYRLSGLGGTVTNSYSSADPSAFSWVFDPLLGGFQGLSKATPAWAGGAGVAHICLPFAAYGLTFDINTSPLTTALGAIIMPGTTSTPLFNGTQISSIVTTLVNLADPAGTDIKPKIDALAAKVLEVETLLDAGTLASLTATVKAFYSKTDVAAEISTAINNFANNVFAMADLVARSSLAASSVGTA